MSETTKQYRNPEEWTTAEMDAHTARGGESQVWLDMGKIEGNVPRPGSRATLVRPMSAKERKREAKRTEGVPRPTTFYDGTTDHKRVAVEQARVMRRKAQPAA